MDDSPADNWSELPDLLQSGGLWGPFTVVDSTGSTNADLASIAGQTRQGHVLVALHQSGGRGRFAREWVSPPGGSISLSFLVAPLRSTADWVWLSPASGMAVRQGLIEATGVDPERVQLKWPNDVLLDGQKVSGILAEQVAVRGGPWAVIGIGINVSLERDQLPVPSATSLLLAGLPTAKVPVVAGVLGAFERYYRDWLRTGNLADQYRLVCSSIGRRVRVVLSPDDIAEGTAVDVDSAGRLMVDTGMGVTRTFAAGDVVHLR